MGAWAAEWKITGVEIIANDQGHRATPSYDAFTDEELVIGDAARSRLRCCWIGNCRYGRQSCIQEAAPACRLLALASAVSAALVQVARALPLVDWFSSLVACQSTNCSSRKRRLTWL